MRGEEQGHIVETSSLQEMFSELPDKAVLVWPASCSTKYVRGREALRPELCSLAGIANCNSSFILQLGGVLCFSG